MDVTTLDGRGYAKFLTAGTYFLRKYRQVLNDLNVFPVPDGDTGTNMYLTVRSAMLEAGKLRKDAPLSEVAAAAAAGSLMGARGNSGVIISQMLRGFAHHVRHRAEVDTFVLATALREAVTAARGALLRPVEGTILSVADAAAEAAYKIALHERDFYRLGAGIVRAANEALDRTPEQLPALKEAGVVDSGGAGFVYFIEAILRFLPESTTRATAFPRRPVRGKVFTASQAVGENKFCTEFVIEDTDWTVHELRQALEPRGESLIVIGAPPAIKVHIHTDDPQHVQDAAGKRGRLTRVKVDNMERQHQLLVVEAPAVQRSIVAVVPGPGFERIVRELGAEVVVNGERNPSVRDLLLAVNKTLGDEVILFVNDANAVLAARELVPMASKPIRVVPTADVVAGIAGLFALGSGQADHEAILAASQHVRSARVFFAGKDSSVGGVPVAKGKPAAMVGAQLLAGASLAAAATEALAAIGAGDGGLVTLYYGGAQKEKDAVRLSEELMQAFPGADIEYYYGGMKNAEYWISFDE